MIISDAITSVYSVIAVWIPVTVVPTSFATVAIAVFMTVVSSAITNCPAASVIKAIFAAPALFAAAPAPTDGSACAWELISAPDPSLPMSGETRPSPA